MIKRSLSMACFFSLLLLFSPTQVFSQDPCEAALEGNSSEKKKPQTQNKAGELIVASSGRDHDVFPTFVEQFQLASEIAADFGITVPRHYAEFVTFGQMKALAAVGHHAAPHWYDGLKMVQGAKGRGGVLEFVHEGCPTCRSYYQDVTKPQQQLSIFFHVLGHNDFGANTIFQRMVAEGDPMFASHEFAEFMRQAKMEHDADEVNQWFQLLTSFINFSDWAGGTYEAPEKFIRPTGEQPVVHAQPRDIFGEPLSDQSPYRNITHPKAPTKHAFQFLVANLPESMPAWKIEMAQRFEKITRVYSGRVNTKFMNEGWATFFQYMLPRFMPWNTSSYLVEYALLLRGVARPGLSNPYWLGTQGWFRLWERFNEQSDVKALGSEKDIFRAFVKYAHKIQGWARDYDFIKFALDEAWVKKYGLYLRRKAEPNEWQRDLPGRKPDDDAQFVVLSNDTQRVLTRIARNTVFRPLDSPSISVVNENGLGRGVFELKHNVFEDVPLVFRSTVEMLYILTRFVEKPVSIETVASSTWMPNKKDPVIRFPWWGPPPSSKPARPEMSPIRIEVSPSGEVKVYTLGLEKDGLSSEEPHTFLTESGQDFVNIYKFDLEGSYNFELAKRDREKYSHQISASEAATAVSEPTGGIISKDPASAEAIWEYYRMLTDRLLRELSKAVRGEIKVKTIKGGVRIKVFPSIPQFALDPKVRELLLESSPNGPIDEIVAPPMMRTLTYEDDNSGIGSGGLEPGDRQWGKDSKKGKGKGEGEEGDPLDPEDPQRPEDFDGPAQDPSEVDIPIDLWSKMLAEEMELPNARRLAGKSDEVSQIRMGSREHPVGEIKWDETIVKALEYSVVSRIQKGLAPFGDDIVEQLIDGVAYITPPDHIVPAYDETPQPEIKAVLVFVIDMTGSMSGLPQQLETEFVKNLKDLIRQQYKHVEFRFVGYDDVAHEFTEEEVLTTFLGGGNTDSKGFEMAEGILKEYPEGAWDRYVVGLGDGGSSDTQATVASMEKLYKMVRYMAWVHTDPHGWHSNWGGFGPTSFIGAIKGLSEQNQWFGFGTVDQEQGSVLREMRKLFGKNQKR